MMALLIILFVLFAIVIIGPAFIGVRSKRSFIVIATLFFCLLLFIGTVYWARGPIQQGYVFARIGPLLGLVWPPNDLYTALAEKQLVSTQKTYFMNFEHKYVGNHAIEIVTPTSRAIGEQRQVQLEVSAKFFLAKNIVFQKKEKGGSPFWGIHSHGIKFIRYSVPADLPVRKPLSVEITVRGDIESFLREDGPAIIKLVKSSDE